MPGFGPQLSKHSARFSIWAPGASGVTLFLSPCGGGEPQAVPLTPGDNGYFAAEVVGSWAGARYTFSRDGGPPLPDPASRFQPDGVFGASELIDLEAYPWTDATWRGRDPEQLVIYELHVGTFCPEGTYAGLLARLDHLVELGVTAVELMPLAAFPGRHNWGYDGVFHFAPFCGYGRPEALQALTDGCHARGLAVILDLVTNHFGPEGNAMWSLAPSFFRPDRPTAWSAGLNWAADPVLRYFDEAVALWLRDYHLDGLRLDAFHAVPAEHRREHLQRMVTAAEAALPAGRQAFVLLESVDNQTSLHRCGTERVRVGQLNFDCQRAAHALLTGEGQQEYADYAASDAELGACLERGFCFVGRYSKHHGRVRGEAGAPPRSWDEVVNFIHNHDTCGNRYLGQRLDALVDNPARLRATTALLLLHPAPPFLFMGQEWGAATPFHFFTDFPEELGQATQQGRLGLFAEVDLETSTEEAPGCQDPLALERSRLDWTESQAPEHRAMLELVRGALAVRREVVPLMSRAVQDLTLAREGDCYRLTVAARDPGATAFVLVANLSRQGTAAPENAELLFSSDAPSSTDTNTVGDPTQVPPSTTALFRNRTL